ncbi:hypothetical protein OSTOST_21490, partial [Ostertagia ostertagi]
MVRPCGCAGTFRWETFTRVCLSRWVAMSNKDQCEICQEKYARSGRTIKPLSKWERPHIGSEESLITDINRCAIILYDLYGTSM